MNLEEKRRHCLSQAHSMQSGVAAEMNIDPAPTQPKHLRVGVNMAMVEHAALVNLLTSKGIITDDEYLDALIEAMDSEIKEYRDRLKQHYGVDISLV